ncbi:MAG: transposase [Burkholderia sp.]
MQTSDDGRPLFMRLSPVPGFTNAALEVWAASSLMSTACVVSDGLWCFDSVTQKAASHERHVTGGGRQAAQRPEFRWVNTMLGNLKTALKGTYHAINYAKYAHRYLAELPTVSTAVSIWPRWCRACFGPPLRQNLILALC